MNEVIYDAYWEGTFNWDDRKNRVKRYHVIYALYGSHHLYGREALLYIGKTNKDLGNRLKNHMWWINDEYEDIKFKVASIGKFTNWKDWNENDYYEKARSHIVNGVEALLIYAHQPAYNTKSKKSLNSSKGFRLINTGKIGNLLPEISYFYFGDI